MSRSRTSSAVAWIRSPSRNFWLLGNFSTVGASQRMNPFIASSAGLTFLSAGPVCAKATYALSTNIEILWLEDGDHDLKPRKTVSGFSVANHLQTLAETAAAWATRIAG